MLIILKFESHKMVEYAGRFLDLKTDVWMYLSSIHDGYCVLRKTMLGLLMYVACWWDWCTQFLFLVEFFVVDDECPCCWSLNPKFFLKKPENSNAIGCGCLSYCFIKGEPISLFRLAVWNAAVSISGTHNYKIAMLTLVDHCFCSCFHPIVPPLP